MKIDFSIPKHPSSASPVVLTIGNFDGMHIGHQAIMRRVNEIAEKQHTESVVLTFSNHPSTVLRPTQPIPLICTVQHRIRLLEDAGIDHIIMIPFTRELSQQTPEEFLRKIQQALPYSVLIFGSDGTIGKNRQGDRATVLALAKTLGFTAEYLPDLSIKGERISSSSIRELIKAGNFSHIAKVLGRPYSIFANVVKGDNRGAQIGFPTANIAVEGLCLPPLGVYAITLTHQEKKYPGIANLGIAPTVRHTKHPILEVHLFDTEIDLYGQAVDVEFLTFIRPEQKFANIDNLKEQIALDIDTAKEIHKAHL